MKFFKKYIRLFLLIASALIFATATFVFGEGTETANILGYVSVGILVLPLLYGFFEGIKEGEFSYECLFLLIATVACIVMGEIEEAESLVFFYNLGELIEEGIEGKFEEIPPSLQMTKNSLEKFSKYYTGVVAIISLLAFLLFLYHKKIGLKHSLEQGLSILILSCPCPLLLCIPLCGYLQLKAEEKNKDKNKERTELLSKRLKFSIRLDISLFIVFKLVVLVASLLGIKTIFLSSMADSIIMLAEIAVTFLCFARYLFEKKEEKN